MASSSSRPTSNRPGGSSSNRPGGQEHRQNKQDFIVKVRYQNHLPPPPNPPKLLDIAVDPIAEYTSTKFVSKLAREQPLNIEADSELGMPLDLLPFGPEIFSIRSSDAHQVIRAAEMRPKVHERDKPLLRPASALGKPNKLTSGVSFLRRTEYISSEVAKSNFKSTTSQELLQLVHKATSKGASRQDNDPLNMLKAVLNGFDVANPPSGKPWNYPKHPTKRGVTAVESWPVLPDLKSHPDGSGFVIVKLSTNPVATTNKRDPGLDFALLVPWNDDGATEESRFHYYLPESDEASHAIKRKYKEIHDPEDDDGYTHVSAEGRKFFKYKRHRAYEYVQPPHTVKDTYAEVVLVFSDGTDGNQKGAYFSPVSQRNNLRPMRSKNQEDQDPGMIDIAEVRFRELLPEEKSRIDDAVSALTEEGRDG